MANLTLKSRLRQRKNRTPAKPGDNVRWHDPIDGLTTWFDRVSVRHVAPHTVGKLSSKAGKTSSKTVIVERWRQYPDGKEVCQQRILLTQSSWDLVRRAAKSDFLTGIMSG